MVPPANARGRPVRDDRVRFGGKQFGATAIRVSAGSFRSLTSLRRNARCDAAGRSNPIDRILSLRIVRLFGVPRFRPPRRSPGLEPRSMFHSLSALRQRCALESLMPRDCRERARRFYLADQLLIIRYCRHYLFAIRLLLEHSLKLQHTKIETPREILVPKSLDFTDPGYRKKLRLLVAKFGAVVHQYFVSLCWLTTLLRGHTPV
jgi:hypothetical protein